MDKNNQKYIWHAQKVRSEHANRDGKVFNVKDGDLPGEDYGCRCYAEFLNEKGQKTGIYARIVWDGDGKKSHPIITNDPKKFNAIDNVMETLEESSTGQCATNVLNGFKKAGIDVPRGVGSAANYGPRLQKAGFKPVSSKNVVNNYKPQIGDIAVIAKSPNHKDRHMATYNGYAWVSDFKQKDMYGGNIRNDNPDYVIYRY